MIECRIVLEYDNEDTALSIFRSIEPDNEGYVSGRVDGNRVILKISGEDALSISHTVNDLLACVKAAEGTFRS